MYVSSDLTNKVGIAAVKDQLDFMLLLKPEDVPLTDAYGIRITANQQTLKDVASNIIPSRINNLSISGLEVTGISVEDREVTVNLTYDGVPINNTIVSEEM